MKEDNYKPKGLLDTDTKNPAVLSFAYLMSNEDFRNDFNDRLLKMSEGTFEKEKALDRLAEFESIYSPLYEQFFARYDKMLKKEGRVEFKTDNRVLFDFSVEEVKEAGWNLVECTYDLHSDERLNEGNVMTEYEKKFSDMGNPICKLIADR